MNTEITTKEKKYTEAQKEAYKRYRLKNIEKIREQRKQYYLKKKNNDPEFMVNKRTKAKEYYQRKKSGLVKSKESSVDSNTEETVEEPIEETKEEVKQEEPVVVVEKPKEVKQKKTSKKRKLN
jgi:hypothetical protein